MAIILSFLWTLDTALGVGCAAAAVKNIFASSVPLADRAESVILSLNLLLVAVAVVLTACVIHTQTNTIGPPPPRTLGGLLILCAQFSHSYPFHTTDTLQACPHGPFLYFLPLFWKSVGPRVTAPSPGLHGHGDSHGARLGVGGWRIVLFPGDPVRRGGRGLRIVRKPVGGRARGAALSRRGERPRPMYVRATCRATTKPFHHPPTPPLAAPPPQAPLRSAAAGAAKAAAFQEEPQAAVNPFTSA